MPLKIRLLQERKLSLPNDYCCDSMRILRNSDSQCDIEVNDEDKLVSCDDQGDRLPPINYCPWCGTELKGD